MLSVRISSYGGIRDVWRAREQIKSWSRRGREQLAFFPNTSASTTRYTHANSMKQLFYFITLLNEIYDEKAKNLVKNGKTKSLTKNSR